MIPNIFDSIFVLIISAFLLSRINISLLAIQIIMMPFFVISLMKFRRRARNNYRNIRKSNSEINLNVQENIEAVRLVRSFTIADALPKNFIAGSYVNNIWCNSVLENIHITTTVHKLTKGIHTLRFYGLDAGVVLQKLGLAKGKLKASFFASEESFYVVREE